MNAETKITKALSGAMALAFAEIEAATKGATNPHFKSKYADLGAIIDAVKPPLIKHGLFFTQRPHPCEGGVSVETVLHHSGGEELSLGVLFVPANKNDAQGFGSALTYCRRYGLMTAFGVPTEDDDGNAAVKSAPAVANDSNGGNGSKACAPSRLPGNFSPTALGAALKLLVHNLNGCGDLGEYIALLETADVKDVIEQCQRRAPAWYSTGEGMPPEFKPLEILLADRKRELAELEGIDKFRSTVDAG